MKHKSLVCAFLATVLLLSLALSGCCISLPIEKLMELPGKTEHATEQATQPADTAPAGEPVEESAEVPAEPSAEAPQPKKEDLLTKTVQQRINLFLSNFSEQGFERYPADDYDLLQFGYMYCKINRNNKLGATGSTYYVKKSDMDTFLKDFFGTTVTAQSCGEIKFADNAYHFPAADGECVDYLSIVSDMEKNSNGSYDVEFDIYLAEYGVEDSYYSMTAQQAAASDKLQWYGSGRAVVRDHTRSTGKVSYQLLRYELD